MAWVDPKERLDTNWRRCQEEVAKGNSISALNEFAALRRLSRPIYVADAAGPGLFRVTCTFQNASHEGFGVSKKIAKGQAAKACWKRLESSLGELRPPSPNKEENNNSNFVKNCPGRMRNVFAKQIQVPKPRDPESGKNTNKMFESGTNNSKNLAFPQPTLPSSIEQNLEKITRAELLSMKTQNGFMANRKEAVNYVGMLQDYCLRISHQTPQYDHRPLKSSKPMFTLTCSFQDHRVTVYRKNLKRCKLAAAIEMLVKLNVIPRPIRPRKTFDDLESIENSTETNFQQILREYCLNDSRRYPCYRHKKLDGKLKAFFVTCFYNGHQVKVSGESISECREAAAEQMLLKLKTTPSEKRSCRQVPETKNKSADSVGHPKTESTTTKIFASKDLQKTDTSFPGPKTLLVAESVKTVNAVEKEVAINESCVITSSNCDMKPEDLEVKKLLELACINAGYCCHQISRKIDIDCWVTTNRIQWAQFPYLDFEKSGRTLESSIAAANKATLGGLGHHFVN